MSNDDLWVTEAWIVMCGDKPIAAPFGTNESAWRWIDRFQRNSVCVRRRDEFIDVIRGHVDAMQDFADQVKQQKD
jgi:hypothetical protein